jgi:hypothetical protein
MLIKKLFLIFLLINFSPALLFAAAQTAFEGQTRLRYEYLGNNSALTNERASYFRFRVLSAIKADFSESVSLSARLNTESRSYIYNSGSDARYNIDEAVFDNFFVLLPDVKGVEIKAGRFDFNPSEYGEGFLIADGTPLDGSRTGYFNALRLRYKNIELLGIYDTKRDFLPVINDRAKLLNSSTETAAAVYGRFKKGDNVFLEPYYIYKEEEGIANINAFGTYFKYAFDGFTLRAQAAFELGDYQGRTRQAFGGYIFGDLPLRLAGFIKPLTLGYIYLSGGDDAWNPLFSRYPWQSEIMATLYAKESGPGYWTNLQLFKAGADFALFEKSSLTASYSYLRANSAMPETGIFGGGKERGHLAAFRLSYEISKDIKAYIHGEYFIAGDYYYKNAKDASFLRVELTAKI